MGRWAIMKVLLTCAVVFLAALSVRGEVPAPVPVPVPASSPLETAAAPAPETQIDKLVFGKLTQMRLQPANLCSDAAFVRRVYLDVLGALPTAQEVRDFLADKDPHKRRALIDRLLDRPEFADYWAMRWSERLRVKAEFPVNLWPNAAQAYHTWIRTSLRENKPYNQFARELLTADGSNFRVPPVNFYRAVQNRTPEGIATVVALTFMGARAENWPKERLAGMAVFFSQIGYKSTHEWKEEIVFWDPGKSLTQMVAAEAAAKAAVEAAAKATAAAKSAAEAKAAADAKTAAAAKAAADAKAVTAPNAAADATAKATAAAKAAADAKTTADAAAKAAAKADDDAKAAADAAAKAAAPAKLAAATPAKPAAATATPPPTPAPTPTTTPATTPPNPGPLAAVFPDGTKVTIPPDRDPREVFAGWLLDPQNPVPARAAVNRVWSWLLGRGIIHEPDDIRPDNPPSNPALLAYLQQEFVNSRYDLKHLCRLILNSETYQLSCIPKAKGPEGAANFAFYPLRRLEAEVLIDAICQITGTTELYTSAIPEPFTFIPDKQTAVALADGSISSPFLELFGRPPRDTGLESERSNKPVPSQRLYMLNSSQIQRKLEDGPRMKALTAATRKQREVTDDLYLTILSRFPTEEEVTKADAYAKSGVVKGREAWIDLAWALINSDEFLYRH